MRIGIFAFRQDPIVSANTSIAYIIGEEIAKTDEVVFIGRKQCEEQNRINAHNCNKIVYLNKKPKNPASSTLLQIALRRIGMFRLSVLPDSLALRRIVRRESIEALICICAPNEDILIARYAELNIPLYLYQLDPYYNQTDLENVKRKKEFLQFLPAFEHLFTTELLNNRYMKDPLFQNYHCITALNFPKLVHMLVDKRTTNEKIVLLYAGTLYRKIRSPKILLNLKNILPDNCRLVFCGSCDFKEDERTLSEQGIVFKGAVPQKEMKEEYAEADILINIGNAVNNQLGSKIVDYIATGKPIINITQIDECPTIPVLQNYDYSLSIRVERLLEERDRIREFIGSTAGKSMAWEDVYEQYYKYTPEYVANCLLKIIKPEKEIKC